MLTVLAVWESGRVMFLGNLIALALAAMAVFGLNLMLSTKDVMILRMAAPVRVQLERNPAPPPTSVVANPFE
jgi:hypothetical protein